MRRPLLAFGSETATRTRGARRGVPPEPHCHTHAGSRCATSDQIARVLPYRTHTPPCGLRSRAHAGCCLRGACIAHAQRKEHAAWHARKPSPHNAWRRLRLGRKSRARIWARAYHPSTQELQNMDAPTAGRYRCTTCAGVRWQGRVPFASRASLPPCGRWTYEVGCEA